MDLSNKIAIVTGARRGMGRTHALGLAKRGAKVVVSDISLKDCKKVVREIEEIGGKALAMKCDISQKKEIGKMVRKTIEKFGKIDILINNAAILQRKPFLEITEKDWNKILDINLKGQFLCSQAIARVMAKQKSGGAIVNIASVAMGQLGKGFKNLVHYCASKGGIIAMTEAMALELAPFNIRVNAVAPGRIDTAMDDTLKQSLKTREKILNQIPLHRVGKPEEVSNLVIFLASDEASYITGSTIIIDGGWMAR
jgi:NAD(P)-dependent dehydrogenase (short-subunit alcohol dehydrogenase family)